MFANRRVRKNLLIGFSLIITIGALLVVFQSVYITYKNKYPAHFVTPEERILMDKWTCGANGLCLDSNSQCPIPTIESLILPKFTPFGGKCSGQTFTKLVGNEIIILNPEKLEISYKISTDLGDAHIDHGVKIHGQCSPYGNKEIFYPTCGPNQQMKILKPIKTEYRFKFLNESIVIAKGSKYFNYITRNVANPKLLKQRKKDFIKYTRKPPNIVVHVLDCTSRAAFQRMLPNTVKYFETLEASKQFKIFQFMRHNFANFQTIKNIPQIFGGFPTEKAQFTRCDGGMKCPEEKCEWLYPFFRKMKYVVSQHSDQDTW